MSDICSLKLHNNSHFFNELFATMRNYMTYFLKDTELVNSATSSRLLVTYNLLFL